MSGDEDEFDDFLARRRKLFRRPESDVLEPPAEVDRIVLREAREAIESRNTDREIRGMSWGAPLALAASLLVAFTIVLNIGMTKREPVPEVTVESVAQRRDTTLAPPAAAADIAPAPGLVSEEEASRYAPAPPPAPAASPARTAAATEAGRAVAKAESTPAWRRESATWLAEIQRLRAAGKSAEADAELAEYRRQHRAYAVSPDR